MTTTPVLGITQLAPGQAVPETKVNEGMRALEQGAAWFRFKDRDLAAPPGSPADGDCYLVAASATGAWAGQDGKIAFYRSSAWVFLTAKEGMAGYIADEDAAVTFDGTDWNTIGGGGVSILDDLTDVDAAAPSDGDVLTYDSGSGDWVPAAPSGGGGGGSDAALFLPEEWVIQTQYNATSLSVLGTTSTASGIGSASYAATNYLTKMRRVVIQPSSTANQQSHVRTNSSQVVPDRGSEFKAIFGIGTGLSTGRIFVGSQNNWPLNNDPSASANNAGMTAFAVAADEGDSNLQVMHKNLGSAMTKIDLGANFPKATAGATYKVELNHAVGGASATYTVTRLDTGDVATGSISSNLPTGTTTMVAGAWNCTGSAGGTAIMGVSIIWGRNPTLP